MRGREWLADLDASTPSRFRGRNRAGMFRWGRVCEIVSAEPYELVWGTVPTARYPDSSEWRIALATIEADQDLPTVPRPSAPECSRCSTPS